MAIYKAYILAFIQVIIIIIIYCLTSDLDPCQAYTDYSLYIYIGRKLYLRNPYNPSSRLLRLAYLAPISYLQCSTTLFFFNLFRNYCCRNKPMDALVLQTLLYYCRVIRGRLLLAHLPSITISFIIQNQSSIFQQISYQVAALRPSYIQSSVLYYYALLSYYYNYNPLGSLYYISRAYT